MNEYCVRLDGSIGYHIQAESEEKAIELIQQAITEIVSKQDGPITVFDWGFDPSYTDEIHKLEDPTEYLNK